MSHTTTVENYKAYLSHSNKILCIDGSGITHCEVPHDEAGLVWDGITFVFLLFQRRIFNSYYFFHIRGETEVQALLASR